MSVCLCREDGMYEGGKTLEARWRISRVDLDALAAVEVSVLWYTEGKGDTDMQVHYFTRFEQDDLRRCGLADEQSLNCLLPATPLSYHGRLIRVKWAVRIRAFMVDGRECMTEQPFYMVAPGSISNGTQTVVGDQRRRVN